VVDAANEVDARSRGTFSSRFRRMIVVGLNDAGKTPSRLPAGKRDQAAEAADTRFWFSRMKSTPRGSSRSAGLRRIVRRLARLLRVTLASSPGSNGPANDCTSVSPHAGLFESPPLCRFAVSELQSAVKAVAGGSAAWGHRPAVRKPVSPASAGARRPRARSPHSSGELARDLVAEVRPAGGGRIFARSSRPARAAHDDASARIALPAPAHA